MRYSKAYTLSGKAKEALLAAVSYTHLDVYKRQVTELACVLTHRNLVPEEETLFLSGMARFIREMCIRDRYNMEHNFSSGRETAFPFPERERR